MKKPLKNYTLAWDVLHSAEHPNARPELIYSGSALRLHGRPTPRKWRMQLNITLQKKGCDVLLHDVISFNPEKPVYMRELTPLVCSYVQHYAPDDAGYDTITQLTATAICRV